MARGLREVAKAKGKTQIARTPGRAILALVLAAVAAGGPAAADTWEPTGRPIDGRQRHTATLLPSGEVLAAGGLGEAGLLSSSERFDPSLGAWRPAAALDVARQNHTATLLRSGEVLVVGGRVGDNTHLRSVELYDPQADQWSSGPPDDLPENKERAFHTATLLPSGEVLVVGGKLDQNSYLGSVELYDPETGQWQSKGPLAHPRAFHTAILLRSGKVLVAGGLDADGDLASVELYDPGNGTWTSLEADEFPCDQNAPPPQMPGPVAPCPLERERRDHTATLLPSGDVLVVGGIDLATELLRVELYHADTGLWESFADPSPGPTPSLERTGHTATLLPSGALLVAGGKDGVNDLASFGLRNGSWTSGDLVAPRSDHTATLLPSGSVLLVGGDDDSAIATAELYTSEAGAWSPAELATGRTLHTATLLSSGMSAGKVLVTGGCSSGNCLVTSQSVELYDPATNMWTSQAGLHQARREHTATLLPSGRVLVIGGGERRFIGGSFVFEALASVELYDPSTGTWASSENTSQSCGPGSEPPPVHPNEPCPLGEARVQHRATLLPSGKVLVTGGGIDDSGSQELASVELYDPDTGLWTSLAPMVEARQGHRATLLHDGRVLVSGGLGVAGSVELYDPATGIWTSSQDAGLFCDPGASPHPDQPCPLLEAREEHTATLLPSGKVLVTAGTTGATAELYDPRTGIWTAAAPVPGTAPNQHTATLLPSGRVLVAGGEDSQDQVLLYHPATDAWAEGQMLGVGRRNHRATLLASGKVLVTGGQASDATLRDSFELYTPANLPDPGRGPLVTRVEDQQDPAQTVPPQTLKYGESFSVVGERFGGDSEAAGGGVRQSAVNYPLVQLQALEGEQQAWLRLGSLPDFCPSELGFCDGQEVALGVLGMPPIFNPGWHLLRVFTAGMAGDARLVEIGCSLEITEEPDDQTADENAGTGTFGPVTFGPVAAEGGRSFQWQRCGGDPATTCRAEDDPATPDVVEGDGWFDLQGATATSYTTPLLDGPESGYLYRAVISSGCKSQATAAAVLSVNDTRPPVVNVVSPDGGRFWQLSDPDTGMPAIKELIAWSMSDDVRVCRVRVSLLGSDDGVDFEELDPDPDADPEYVLPVISGADPPPPCFPPEPDDEPPTFYEYHVPRSFAPLGGSGRQFKVRVVAIDHAGNDPSCNDPDDCDCDAIDNCDESEPFFIERPNDGSIGTLILWNRDRMGERFPSADLDDLEQNLTTLANHPQVQGRLIDLEGVDSLTPLYTAWDGAPGDVTLANAVLFDPDDGCADTDDCTGLQAYLLDEVLPVFTGVEHLVLVGGDDVIPMARLEDRARVLSEKSYPDGVDLTPIGSTVGRALAENQYLSDDPLASRDRVTLDSEGSVTVGSDVCADAAEDLAWLPDLAVGRLVETPAEITRTINAFISQSGIQILSPRFCSGDGTLPCEIGDCPSGQTCDLAPGQVLVTGYDFLLDSSAEIVGRWEGPLGTSTVNPRAVGDLLVDPTQNWGTTKLQTGLCGDGDAVAAGPGYRPYPVASLNGHANHYAEGVPGDLVHFDDGLDTAELAADEACGPATELDLSGAVIYAVGCHGGLPVARCEPGQLDCNGDPCDQGTAPDPPCDDPDNSFDLPQTFMGLGAVAYVANTGYGWGLREGPPGYGERLVVLMTEQLADGGTVSVGEAVKAAKTLYVSEDSGCFDAYDQKSVMQWTLFGLPMYSVQLPVPSAAAAAGSAPERPVPSLEEWPEEEHYGDAVVTRRESPSRAPLPNFLTRLELHFDFSAPGVYRKFYSQRTNTCSTDPSQTCNSDAECPMSGTEMGICGPASVNVELGDPVNPPTHSELTAIPCPANPSNPADPVAGCYYALNGLATGQADLPVQPYFVFESRLSGTSQHGVLWTGGTYEQESDWKPLRPPLQSNNDPSVHGDFSSNLGALSPQHHRARPRPTRVLPGADPSFADGCPPSDLELNKLVVPTGEMVTEGSRCSETTTQTCVVDDDCPNQQTCEPPPFERRDLTVDLEILYFNDTTNGSTSNCDRIGPDIAPVGDDYHQVTGTEIEWRVEAKDGGLASEVWKVLVVIDNESQSRWEPIELAYDGMNEIWTGVYDLQGGGELSYFLQAVDRRGNVSWVLYEPVGSIPPDQEPCEPPLPASCIPSGQPLATAVEVTASADLSITKDDGVASAVPGTPLTYTLTVANVGSSGSSGGTVTDVLPAALAFVSSASGCTETGGTVSCPFGPLAAGGSVMLSFVASIDPSATGQIDNMATVDGNEDDPNGGNDTFAHVTTLTPSADLSIAKDDGEASAVPGESLTYTLTVANAGPSDSSGGTVSDVLPAGLSFVSSASGCSESGGTVSCPFGPVAAGGSVQVSFVASIDPAQAGTIDNTAGVSGNESDPDGGNDAGAHSTPLARSADLSLVKDDGVASAVPGELLTYTLTVANAGPSDSSGGTVSDVLPAGLAFDSSASGCGEAGGTVSCPFGSLAAGDSVDLSFVAAIDSAQAGTIDNTAGVSGDDDDPDSGNDSGAHSTPLSPEADLSITKTDGVTSAVPGETVTYTIAVSNAAGPSAVAGATVSDDFPPSLDCLWTCIGSGGATCTPGQVAGEIDDLADLPVGGTATYTAVCAVDPEATGTLANTASVEAPAGVDPNPANDSASDLDTVLSPSADLSITKSDGVTSAVPGEPLTYAIVAANAGPSDAVGAQVGDSFPAELSCQWTCAGAGGGSCTAGPVAGDVADMADLPVGATATYTAVCDVDLAATGTLANTATVSPAPGTADPDPANNSASDLDTELQQVVDLAITKGDGVTSAVPGEPLTYTIVVSNQVLALGSHGEQIGRGVTGATVSDLFPPELDCGWTCAPAGGASCTAGPVAGNLVDTVDLPLGSSLVYTADCGLAPDATGTLSNTAEVSPPAGVIEHDPADNSATDEDDLTPQADLSITKTDGVTSALPGESVTYTLTVTNAGPSVATGTVTDLFPPELDCAWTCAGSGGATCTPGQVAGDVVDPVSLPVAGVATYTAVCAIDLTATGTLLNTATVEAPAGLDPNPANDAATDLDTALDAQADLGVAKDDGQTAATPGAPISYTITLTNNGPVTVTAATVVDDLPPEILDPVFTPSEGSYDSASGAWSGLILAAGGSVTLTLDGTVDEAASGQLVNSASVAAPAGVIDPEAGNNVAEDVNDLGPIVSRVHSVASTGGGVLAADERTRATLTQLVAEFNEPVTGAGAAASYLLVEAGVDRELESESCALGRVGDDVEVAIAGAGYDPTSRTAALAVNGGLPLPQGRYRLLVCDVIEDLLGNPLAGGDFARDFSVMVVHLLRNPTFDADLEDWLTDAEPPGDLVHDPLDADGAATSGSARVLGLAPPGELYSLSQCLPTSPDSGLTFGGSARLDSPSPSGPLAFAQVELFALPGCRGEAFASVASGAVDVAPGALWQTLPVTAAATPAGALSALVSFVVDPSGAMGFDVYFDDLYVYLHLFTDGFESGDTSRWSGAGE